LCEEDVLESGLAEAEWREATVPAEQHGERLDRALARLAPEFSRSYLQQLIEAGAVQQAGQRISKASAKVKAGQALRIELRPTPQSQAFQPEAMPLAVVHEDAHLLVIDKPAGLVVHPAPGNWSGTLLNGLLAHHAGARLLPRAGIVHRLDKDTSGLMVVAKTRAAMDALVTLIAAREVRREYIALAHRPWQGPPQARVEQPIGRDPRQRVRMAVVDLARQAGKPALTEFRLLASQPQASLLHCKLHTGRTHQIRVHLQHLGHPLLADELYGGKPLAGLQRQALHAWRLSLAHPLTGQTLSWRSPLAPDMRQALAGLGLQGVAELE
jgi:23S rRNA pseudouridine1911/1915/1917 synthase